MDQFWTLYSANNQPMCFLSPFIIDFLSFVSWSDSLMHFAGNGAHLHSRFEFIFRSAIDSTNGILMIVKMTVKCHKRQSDVSLKVMIIMSRHES